MCEKFGTCYVSMSIDTEFYTRLVKYLFYFVVAYFFVLVVVSNMRWDDVCCGLKKIIFMSPPQHEDMWHSCRDYWTQLLSVKCQQII